MSVPMFVSMNMHITYLVHLLHKTQQRDASRVPSVDHTCGYNVLHTYSGHVCVHVCTYVHVPFMWLVGCQLRFLVELLHLSLHMCHMHGNAHTYIHRVCLVVSI